MPRTALIGAYAGSVQAFTVLAAHSQLTLIVAPARPSGDQLAAVAAKRNISVLRGAHVKDPGFANELRARDIDLVINVLSPYVICSAVIDAARIGAFNLHPSLLPRYGGRNPTAWAIYYGETTHGATLHWIDTQIDTGPIALQRELPITAGHTPISLLRETMRAGAALLEELIRRAQDNPAAIPRIPQDPSRRQYFGGEAPEGGELTWDRPARDVLNFVRAFDYAPAPCPWGLPSAWVNGNKVSLVKASPTGEPCWGVEPGALKGDCVATSDEWVRVEWKFNSSLTT